MFIDVLVQYLYICIQTNKQRFNIDIRYNDTYISESIGKTVTFEKGEKLLLYGGNGMSHKYTFEQLEHLFTSVGLQIVKQWNNGHSALTMVKRKF